MEVAAGFFRATSGLLAAAADCAGLFRGRPSARKVSRALGRVEREAKRFCSSVRGLLPNDSRRQQRPTVESWILDAVAGSFWELVEAFSSNLLVLQILLAHQKARADRDDTDLATTTEGTPEAPGMRLSSRSRPHKKKERQPLVGRSAKRGYGGSLESANSQNASVLPRKPRAATSARHRDDAPAPAGQTVASSGGRLELLPTADLAALVLDTGNSPEMAKLVAQGLRALVQITSRELSHSVGMGESKARRLLAALELGRRWAVEPGKHTKRYTCGRDLFEHYHLRLRDKKREHFICALFDQKNRLIRDEVVSIGSLSRAYVHPREAFRSAVRESAAAVVFIHNHPSGDARPSEEDRLLTTKLAGAAELLGIRLLDHVIIGDGCFYSFFEEGVL